MYNNSKKLVIFGLVSILLIAGLYPVFSDTNQPEITKIDRKIQTFTSSGITLSIPCIDIIHNGVEIKKIRLNTLEGIKARIRIKEPFRTFEDKKLPEYFFLSLFIGLIKA